MRKYNKIHGSCRRFRGDQNDEDKRTFCGKFLYNNAIASTDNAQHKNCPSSGIDDRSGRDLFRVLKRSPISQPSMRLFRWEGSRQHDRTPTKIAFVLEKIPYYSHYAEGLARLKQVPICKVMARPGRDSNHVNNDLPDMKRALYPIGHTSGEKIHQALSKNILITLFSKIFKNPKHQSDSMCQLPQKSHILKRKSQTIF